MKAHSTNTTHTTLTATRGA